MTLHQLLTHWKSKPRAKIFLILLYANRTEITTASEVLNMESEYTFRKVWNFEFDTDTHMLNVTLL